jgi:hypothetical protein
VAAARSRAELVARAYHDGILSPNNWPPELDSGAHRPASFARHIEMAG